MSKNKKIIFNLGRNGGLPLYAKHVIEYIAESEDIIVNSCFSDFIPKTNSKNYQIPTYRTRLEFILFTIAILPILLLYIFKLRLFDGYNRAYFPYIHFWTSPILCVCKLLRIKSYVTVHDGRLHLGDGIPLEELNLKASIKLSDSLIYLSEYVREQVASHYDIYNKEHFVSSLGTMAQVHDIEFVKKDSHGSDSFLFFGRVSKYKGVEMMLDSFNSSSILKDKKITVAGKSNYNIDYSLYSDLPRLDVIDRYISEQEIQQLFDSHDVLVLPYIDATQSGVLTYALKSRTIVVMTNIGGLSEQVDEESVYLCEPNRESLRESLELLVTDNKNREKVFNKFVHFCQKEDNSLITEKLKNYLA